MDAVDHTNASKTSKDKPRTIPRLAKFTAFVTKVVARLPLTTPELLLTVAYVDRAQYRNNSKSFSSYGNERMFLGALALALRVHIVLPKQIMQLTPLPHLVVPRQSRFDQRH